LQKGVTSQTEVLEKFGSPNIATTDGDMEVWTYQRHGTTSKSAGVGGSLILLGGEYFRFFTKFSYNDIDNQIWNRQKSRRF
jgi:hypothetical protein